MKRLWTIIALTVASAALASPASAAHIIGSGDPNGAHACNEVGTEFIDSSNGGVTYVCRTPGSAPTAVWAPVSDIAVITDGPLRGVPLNLRENMGNNYVVSYEDHSQCRIADLTEATYSTTSPNEWEMSGFDITLIGSPTNLLLRWNNSNVAENLTESEISSLFVVNVAGSATGVLIQKSRPGASHSFGVRATVAVTFSGGVPTDGQTITVDGIVYTFETALDAADFNGVLIGASAAATRTNFIAAINRSGTPGSLYSFETPPHPTVSATESGSTVVLSARVPGTYGNTIAVSETASNVTSPANLSGGAFGSGCKTGSVDVNPNLFGGRTVMWVTQPVLNNFDIESDPWDGAMFFGWSRDEAGIMAPATGELTNWITDGGVGWHVDTSGNVSGVVKGDSTLTTSTAELDWGTILDGGNDGSGSKELGIRWYIDVDLFATGGCTVEFWWREDQNSEWQQLGTTLSGEICPDANTKYMPTWEFIGGAAAQVDLLSDYDVWAITREARVGSE